MGRYKEVDVALQDCPKGSDGLTTDANTLQYVGPTDSGLVAISCHREAIVVELATGKVTPIPAPDKDTYFRVMGIANDGSVAGCAGHDGIINPFIYRFGKFSYVLPESNLGSCATGVNSSGQVVGYVGDKVFILKP